MATRARSLAGIALAGSQLMTLSVSASGAANASRYRLVFPRSAVAHAAKTGVMCRYDPER